MIIRYLNVQHWTNDKQAGLALHLTLGNPDIILLTSTSRTREQGPIKIPLYNTFTTNKHNERHAGAGIAIKYGVNFELLNSFQHDTIGVKITTSTGPLIIMTSYAPPRQIFLPNQDLEYLINNRIPTILAGDLNCRHQHFGYNTGTNAKGRAMYQHIFNNRLNHIGPTFPTFYTRNSETKPDLVITNNRFFLNHLVSPGEIGPSDHITINITISSNAIRVHVPPYSDIKNANWDEYKDILANIPEINIDGGNTETIKQEMTNLYESIQHAKQTVTPIKNFVNQNNLNISTKFKRLTKILDRYHQALIANGKTPYLARTIRNTQLMLIEEGNACKIQWWEKQIEKIELSAKCNIKFWRQIKKLSGKKRTITPPLKYKENNIDKTAKTDEEKANILQPSLKKHVQLMTMKTNNIAK